jgi:hypothetical protein
MQPYFDPIRKTTSKKGRQTKKIEDDLKKKEDDVKKKMEDDLKNRRQPKKMEHYLHKNKAFIRTRRLRYLTMIELVLK